MIVKKSTSEIERMARSGLLLAAVHDRLRESARPGVTTAQLDEIAEEFIRGEGGVPTFKGYRGFPGSICASPNEMIVHGIPGGHRLEEGDIISLDVGVTLGGWVSDAAVTLAIGEIDPGRERLLAATEASLFAGVEQAVAGNRMGDLSHAIQHVCEEAGLSVVRSLVGHGVGREMHEDPQVPNYGKPGRGVKLEEGMVLAIEPMTTLGRAGVHVGEDSWAIYADDGSPTAHFEFTVAITADGPRILTPWHIPSAERRPAAVQA